MHVGRWVRTKVVHGRQWTQVAMGIAGWTTIRLCIASSFM